MSKTPSGVSVQFLTSSIVILTGVLIGLLLKPSHRSKPVENYPKPPSVSAHAETPLEAFDADSTPVSVIASGLILKYYGPRHNDHHEDCESCRRWEALDVLLENPFKD